MANAAYTDTVQKVYIAYYGRAADPEGLAYWEDQLTASDGVLSTIMNSFGASDEATALFGSQENEAKINTLYNQMFGRDGDTAGVDFYLAELNAGTMTAATIAQNILDGASGADATIITNKLAVANSYTAAIVADSENVDAYANDAAITSARTLLATVTAATDTATFDVATSIATMVSTANAIATYDADIVTYDAAVVTHTNALDAAADSKADAATAATTVSTIALATESQDAAAIAVTHATAVTAAATAMVSAAAALTTSSEATQRTSDAAIAATNTGTAEAALSNASTAKSDADAVKATANLAVTAAATTFTLSESSSTFTESTNNDGTISNSITLTLSGDTYASDVVSSGTKITTTNVPAGLTASFARTSDTVITVTLTGTAGSHAADDNISNLAYTFSDGAFVTNAADSSAVTNYTKANLIVDYVDADTQAPTNQDTVLASSVIAGAAVTIVSSGDATNDVWLAPSGTTVFTANATTITKATSGTATSITSPTTEGDYQVFVTDAAGNISTASTAIVTVDTSAPTATVLSPLDNAIGITDDTLTITMNENVVVGTGNVVIYDSGDTVIHTIDIADATQVTFDGTTDITIDPTGGLAGNEGFYVKIDATAIVDTAGNAYAGISNNTDWSFQTAGTVSDGLISGATVFLDANSNGLLDNGETSTTTDANGQFFLSNKTDVTIVATGGTDTSTGLAFTGYMKAEAGGGALNPLTSFLGSSLSSTNLLASLDGFMGINTSDITDIANYDPMTVISDSSSSAAEITLAIKVQNVAVQMLNIVDFVADAVVVAIGDITAYQARASSIIVDEISSVLNGTTMAQLLSNTAGAMTTLGTSIVTAIATDIVTLKFASNTSYGNLVAVDPSSFQGTFAANTGSMITNITSFATSMQGASTNSSTAFVEDMIINQIGTAIALGSNNVVAVKGTSGDDAVTSSGSGSAMFLTGSGADTLTLTGSADTVTFLESTSGSAFGANTGYNTINSFAQGSDKLSICLVYESSMGGGATTGTLDVATFSQNGLNKDSNDNEIFVLSVTTVDSLTTLSSVIAAIGTITSTDEDEFLIAINNTEGTQAGLYAIDTSGTNAGTSLDASEIAIVGIVNTDGALDVSNFGDFSTIVGI